MFYQPLEVPIQGVWTIVVELKTVTPVAAAAVALAGNDGSGAQELWFFGGSKYSQLLLRLDLVNFRFGSVHFCISLVNA